MEKEVGAVLGNCGCESHHRQLKHKCTTLFLSIISIATIAIASSPSQDLGLGMQIVLSGRTGLYLANWRERDLEPRLITDFGGKVLVSRAFVSSVNRTIAVVGLVAEGGENRDVVFLVDPSSGAYQEALRESETFNIHGISIAPDKQSIAFLSHNPQAASLGMDILVYDLTKHQPRVLAPGHGYVTLVWSPDGQELTYDTPEGWVESFTLNTHRVERLVQGRSPAWSPDGRGLVYYRGDAVFSYDPVRGNSREIHRRSWWQRGIIGSLYWSPNARHVSFNVSWDLLGLTSQRCVVLNVDSGQAIEVRAKGLYCGPWLASRQ